MSRFRYGVRTDNAILRSHASLAECRAYLAELTITGHPGEEMGAYIARWTTRADAWRKVSASQLIRNAFGVARIA